MNIQRGLSAALVGALCILTAGDASAQSRRPRPEEVAAIRGCAEKHQDDIGEGERQCLFKLVAEPCTQTAEGKSNLGTADCYRVEQAIWDTLLNENFKALRDDLDDKHKSKLREMQRAWVADRDMTCQFYSHRVGGSMAAPMTAACLARETARRALLLDFFKRL